MYANPIDLLKAFLSNNAATQKEAENTLSQLAKSDSNTSMDLYISAIDNQDSHVSFISPIILT